MSPRLDSEGWPFANVDPYPGAEVDPLYGASHMKDIYLKAEPNYNAKYAAPSNLLTDARSLTLVSPPRYTVPVLWDKKTRKIVNNESSEIIRIFNSAFNHLLPPEYASVDLYPAQHRAEIDELNEWVYDTVNSEALVLPPMSR